MDEVVSLKLENGMDYYPLRDIVIDGIKYYLLQNVNDKKDICIRKEIIEDEVCYISMLDDDNELQKVVQFLKIK